MSSGLVSSTSSEVYTSLVRSAGSSPSTVSRTARIPVSCISDRVMQ